MRVPAEFEQHPTSFSDALKQNKHRAICKKIIDGDTYDFLVDLGYNVYVYLAIRLNGLDTDEIFRPVSPDKMLRGTRAASAASGLLLGEPCLLKSYKDKMTFGRYVADIEVYSWDYAKYLDIATELKDYAKRL